MDINEYALKIQLQLDYSEIDTSINKLSKQLSDLEKSIHKSASAALGSIRDLTKEVTEAVKDLVVEFKSIDPQLDKIQQIYETLDNTVKKNRNTAGVTSEELTTILDGILSKYFDENKLLEERNKAYKDINKHAQDLLDIEDDIHKSIIQNNNAKNKGFNPHSQYNGYRKIQRILESYYMPFKILADDIASVVKGTEDYITSNYRLQDSMNTLMLESKSVGAQIGLADAEAAKLLKTLMHYNLPRKQLNQLAVSLGKANRYLGVNEVLLGKQFAMLNKTGHSIEETNKYMENFANTMANTGATAEDVTSILEDQNLSIIQLTRNFGGYTKEGVRAAQATQQLAISLRALSKAYNLDPNRVSSDLSKMVEPLSETNMKMFGLTGMLVNDEKTAAKALEIMTDRISTIYKQMQDAQARHDSISVSIYRSQMEALTGLSIDTIDLHARVKELRQEHYKATGQQLEYTQALEQARKELQPYEASIESFVSQLRLVYRALYPLYVLIAAAAEVAMYFLMGVNYVIDGITTLSQKFYDWLDAMEANGGASAELAYIIRSVGKALYYAAGAFILLGGIMLTVGVGVGKIMGLFAGLLRMIVGIPSILTGLTASISGFVTGLTTMISNAMQQIAVAISRFAKTVGKDILVILASSLAFALFAASVYVIVQSVIALTKSGNEAIVMMGALAVGMALFTAIFVASMIAIAATAGVTAPLLLAAGLAFLMFAGGIAIASYGIAELVKSFTGLIDVMLTKLPEIGPTLYTLGGQVMAAGAMLIIGSGLLLVGATGLTVAIGALVTAGSLLLLSSVLINAAISAFDYYASSFGASAKRFYDSTNLLVESSGNLLGITQNIKLLSEASNNLALSAYNLSRSATSIVYSVGFIVSGITTVSSGMVYAIASLNVVVPMLDNVANRFMNASYKFYASSKTIGLAVSSIQYINTVLDKVSFGIYKSSVDLSNSTVMLDKSSKSMMYVALKLMGVSMIFGSSIGTFSFISEKFAAASSTIYVSAKDFNNSTSLITKGIDDLVLASSKLDHINGPIGAFSSSIHSILNMDVAKFTSNLKDIAAGFKYIKDIDAEAINNTVILSSAIANFEDPIIKLASAVEKLHEAVTLLDKNSILNKDLGNVVTTTSDKSNLNNVVKTSPIQNVMVNVHREEDIGMFDEHMTMNKEILDTLNRISESLGIIASSDNGEDILTLLKSFLPMLVSDNRDLPRHFNKWS